MYNMKAGLHVSTLLSHLQVLVVWILTKNALCISIVLSSVP
jgi:hypothetical protein